ncbi:MAG TPA: P1 family peptidase [Longimicrobiales bacterium]|nr:P1 family peptidase [Longimicrobiales bacterium]
MLNPSLTAVPGLRVGHAQDETARTGCTVIVGPFRGAAYVCGFATGTRELGVLDPNHLAPRADALLLTGGSAFGLAAADGVMKWLEERGLGFDAGIARVPLVPAAVIFDLATGSADRRPDAAMGRAACEAASAAPVAEGAVGAGCGATVGKILGPQGAQPGGVGSWAVMLGTYTVAALAVVNAFGDVLRADGSIMAGAQSPDGSFVNAAELLRRGLATPDFARAQQMTPSNTTLAAVATDAPLDRTELAALAHQSANALARRIAPVFTPFDGDIVFALSTANEPASIDAPARAALAAAAQFALEVAIERGVTAGRSVSRRTVSV